MNLFGRFLYLLIRNVFVRESASLVETCRTRFRVHLSDLDINLHMNNGRYLSIMDLGRLDLMLKAGIFYKLFSKGYYPVVTSEAIRFRKSLEYPQRYTLETRIESWDEKDFYIRQSFWREKDLVAVGIIKGRFRKRGKNSSVPTSQILQLAHVQLSDLPSSTEASSKLFQMEKLLEQEKVRTDFWD